LFVATAQIILTGVSFDVRQVWRGDYRVTLDRR
jgi:hypothetical protein